MAKVQDAAPANPFAGLQDQASALYRDSLVWMGSNSLQILVSIAIGAAVVAALLGVRMLGVKLCRRDSGLSHWPTVLARTIVQTHVWFMVAVAAKLVEGYAETPPAVSQTITFFFTVASALQAAIWARELILGMVELRAGGSDPHSSLGSAIDIIRLLVSITVFAIALLMILDNLGVNVTGLIAGLGIGGIAIGLAAKGIFDDLFSALSIIFDKPFRRGDSVRWDTTSGTVEAIGLKTTRVRAVTGEEVVISNTNLLNKELHNLARLDRRRIILAIGVIYQTPVEVCADIPEMMRKVVEDEEKCTLVRCGLINLGASSIDYELQFDVHSEVFDVLFNARHRVILGILKRFNEAGIEFAYPTQTVFTAAPDGKAIMPYAEPARSAGQVPAEQDATDSRG
jgi:small-conductance mechanosensitive channel